jgi:hypothetical protein
MKLNRLTRAFAALITAVAVEAYTADSPKPAQKKPDIDWGFASGRTNPRWGATAPDEPNYVDPYKLEDAHSAKELRPPYEIDVGEVKPVPMQSLEALRETVNSLKQDVFQSKARAFEIGMEGKNNVDRTVSHAMEKQFATVSLTHLDRMSSLYDLVSLQYYLDGQKIYTYLKDSDRSISSIPSLQIQKPSYKIYEGFLPPGQHIVTIHAIFQGNGEGMFRYLNDYRVRVVDEKNFGIEAGQNYSVTVTAYEKGRFYTSFRERPAFQLDVGTGAR